MCLRIAKMHSKLFYLVCFVHLFLDVRTKLEQLVFEHLRVLQLPEQEPERRNDVKIIVVVVVDSVIFSFCQNFAFKSVCDAVFAFRLANGNATL